VDRDLRGATVSSTGQEPNNSLSCYRHRDETTEYRISVEGVRHEGRSWRELLYKSFVPLHASPDREFRIRKSAGSYCPPSWVRRRGLLYGPRGCRDIADGMDPQAIGGERMVFVIFHPTYSTGHHTTAAA
jgi:hypothetical protein